MEFKWLNESTIKKTDDRIEIKAPGQTFFAEVFLTGIILSYILLVQHI